jgi:hypothetical protein
MGNHATTAAPRAKRFETGGTCPHSFVSLRRIGGLRGLLASAERTTTAASKSHERNTSDGRYWRRCAAGEKVKTREIELERARDELYAAIMDAYGEAFPSRESPAKPAARGNG